MASCAVDVLGSHKAKIAAYTAYVTRCSAGFDGSITDTLYAAKATPTVTHTTLDNVFQTTLSNGCYVLGVTNNSTTTIGCTCYYAMEAAVFGSLRSYLMSDTFANLVNTDSSGTVGVDISTSTLKAFYNPMQYIVSCQWFPVKYSNIGGSSLSSMRLGWWTLTTSDIGSLAVKLLSPSNGYIKANTGVTLVNHPQATSRGNYLNKPPYRNATIFYPGFGQIAVDVANMTSNALYLEFVADITTGEATLVLRNGSSNTGAVLGRWSSKVGVDLPVAQITYSPSI